VIGSTSNHNLTRWLVVSKRYDLVNHIHLFSQTSSVLSIVTCVAATGIAPEQSDNASPHYLFDHLVLPCGGEHELTHTHHPSLGE